MVHRNAGHTHCAGAAAGDARAVLLELPETTPETVGARQHPGAENHRQAAEVLTAFLKEHL